MQRLYPPGLFDRRLCTPDLSSLPLGDSFIMKPGYRGVWKSIETVRKIYVNVGWSARADRRLRDEVSSGPQTGLGARSRGLFVQEPLLNLYDAAVSPRSARVRLDRPPGQERFRLIVVAGMDEGWWATTSNGRWRLRSDSASSRSGTTRSGEDSLRGRPFDRTA